LWAKAVKKAQLDVHIDQSHRSNMVKQACFREGELEKAGFHNFVRNCSSDVFSVGQPVLLYRPRQISWRGAFAWCILLVCIASVLFCMGMAIAMWVDRYFWEGLFCSGGVPLFALVCVCILQRSVGRASWGLFRDRNFVDEQAVELGVVRTVTFRNQHFFRVFGFERLVYFYDVDIATAGENDAARSSEHVDTRRQIPASRLREATCRAFDKVKPTQQADYYESINERVGADPGGDEWKEELVEAMKEDLVWKGKLVSMDVPLGPHFGWMRSFEGFCKHFKVQISDELQDSALPRSKFVLTVDEKQVKCDTPVLYVHASKSIACNRLVTAMEVTDTAEIAGNVAVVERASCGSAEILTAEIERAVDAGAVAVIVINKKTPGLQIGTQGFRTLKHRDFAIPVLSVDYATGQLLVPAVSVEIAQSDGYCRALRIEAAQLAVIFSRFGSVLSAATREGRHNYAGLIHRYHGWFSRLATGQPLAFCYHNCENLEELEPGWKNLVDGAVAEARGGKGCGHSSSSGEIPPLPPPPPLSGTYCLTAASTTNVVLPAPRLFASGGFRTQKRTTKTRNGSTTIRSVSSVHESAIVQFISASSDASGFHTAVRKGAPHSRRSAGECAFPPMTLFSADSVQLDEFEYDGTQDLLDQCRRHCGGIAPEPVVNTGTHNGRPHVTRAQLVEWLVENSTACSVFGHLRMERADLNARKVCWRAQDYVLNSWWHSEFRTKLLAAVTGLIVVAYITFVYIIQPWRQGSVVDTLSWEDERGYGCSTARDARHNAASRVAWCHDAVDERGRAARVACPVSCRSIGGGGGGGDTTFGETLAVVGFAIMSALFCKFREVIAHVLSKLCATEVKRKKAADDFHRNWLPPGVESTIYTVHQTLVTVRATYLFPVAMAAGEHGDVAGGGGCKLHHKLTSNSTELVYGDRMTFVRGVVEIVFLRPLTIQEEWERNHEWEDWNKIKFSGKAEWEYVWKQPARETEGYGKSMLLDDFRELFVDRVNAVGGGEELVPTREEVAAARLYTGPAYVKLNGFMRLVGSVPERHWRARFAQLHCFTYSSTVFHLINCIRKITQIDALEQKGQKEVVLYRAVRGTLPAEFYKEDDQGLITAVDYGFVSTSTDPEVPISFMASDQCNVLWVMHGSHTADGTTGQLHNGAVLQPLSQYPAEAETLLPPLCMLRVLREGGATDTTGAFQIRDKKGTNMKGEVVTFKEIHVCPCFF
jgi:hypothetical protein